MTTPIQTNVLAEFQTTAPSFDVSSRDAAFRRLFTETLDNSPSAAAPAATPPSSAGENASSVEFESSVTGTSSQGTLSVYNCQEYATETTAQAMAQKIGGSVEELPMTGTYSCNQPQRMIAAGGHLLNAGLVASLFDKYGDAPASQAWQIIDASLGDK